MADVETIKKLAAATNTAIPYTSDAVFAARMMVPLIYPGEAVPRFAAIKSRKFDGRLTVLGGAREPGESTEDTARREAFEEGGVIVHSAVWVGDQPTEQPSGRFVACYLATRWSFEQGRTDLRGSSEGDPAWVTMHELFDDAVSMFTNGNAVSLLLVTAWAKAQPHLPCAFGAPYPLELACGI